MTTSENQRIAGEATVLHLSVSDMTCGHCAASISQAIQRLDATANVAVDLSAKRVQVETSLGPEAIMAALEEAGFTPEPVSA